MKEKVDRPIHIDSYCYERILRVKHKLEAIEKKCVSMNDALRHILDILETSKL